MIRWHAVGIILISLLTACQHTGSSLQNASYQHGDMYLQGVFEGTLPCADCGGIATELVVWSKGEHDYTECWFRLTETYLATSDGDKTYTTEGVWYLERGSGDDPDDTVYALSMGNNEWRNFVIDDVNTLSMLGKSDNKRIQSGQNYALKRK